MNFVLRSSAKTIGEYGTNWVSKTFLDLDSADDLSIPDENFSKVKEVLKFLRVQCARIGLRINVKKTKSLRLGISIGEYVILGN